MDWIWWIGCVPAFLRELRPSHPTIHKPWTSFDASLVLPNVVQMRPCLSSFFCVSGSGPSTDTIFNLQWPLYSASQNGATWTVVSCRRLGCVDVPSWSVYVGSIRPILTAHNPTSNLYKMADSKPLSQFTCCQVWTSYETGTQMLIVNAWESWTSWPSLEIELATSWTNCRLCDDQL